FVGEQDGIGYTVTAEGDGQTGQVGSALREALRVQILDSSGRAVNGIKIDWVVTSGGGSASSTTTSTSGDGSTEVSWTLGGTTGSQTLEGRVGQQTDHPIRFTATAVAGPIASVTVSPSRGSVNVGGSVQFQAVARDQFGNTRPATFRWRVEHASIA